MGHPVFLYYRTKLNELTSTVAGLRTDLDTLTSRVDDLTPDGDGLKSNFDGDHTASGTYGLEPGL